MLYLVTTYTLIKYETGVKGIKHEIATTAKLYKTGRR